MGAQKELKILLAEDNKINQHLATFTFIQLELKFDIASNGKEALKMYQQNKYDLILMDMHMPEMDGLEATRLIRAFETESGMQHRVIIVALTASMVSDKMEECFEAGMDDFMEKPIHKNMLRKLISRFWKSLSQMISVNRPLVNHSCFFISLKNKSRLTANIFC